MPAASTHKGKSGQDGQGRIPGGQGWVGRPGRSCEAVVPPGFSLWQGCSLRVAAQVRQAPLPGSRQGIHGGGHRFGRPGGVRRLEFRGWSWPQPGDWENQRPLGSRSR